MPPGTLFVVATPLGNLQDITPRALEVLRAAAVVACEDTRRTRSMLERFGIKPARVISYHKFNESRRRASLLSALLDGKDVALVSDGGTPGISDPGAAVVSAALDEGLPVSPVPGPSAVAAAVSVCGFEAPSFVFVGFLPAKGSARREALEGLRDERRPMVLFEAPHRVARTSADLLEILGDRPVTVLREVTKRFEEVRRVGMRAFAESLERGEPRGEFTLVVQGRGDDVDLTPLSDETVRDRYARLLAAGIDRREALRHLARESGMPRRRIYDILKTR